MKEKIKYQNEIQQKNKKNKEIWKATNIVQFEQRLKLEKLRPSNER